MKRTIWNALLTWKDRTGRKPLILRGVRQCGKTWIIREFGSQCFPDHAYFNFEGNLRLHAVFEADLDPERILMELELLQNRRIDPAKTLIIFDEIQFCGKALTSLKYFNENLPSVPIIAAGSLLGLSLSKPLSFPVGKVDFLDLYPLSFSEFLLACGEDLLFENLSALGPGVKVPDSLHMRLTELLRDYFYVGGMPEAVNSWVHGHDPEDIDRIQRAILDSYELDFAKHAPDSEFDKLSSVWHAAPVQLAQENQKFIFSRVKEGYRGRDLEGALQWLLSAGLVYKVPKIEKPGIPLSAYADDSHFKLYLCDIGLLRAMAGIPLAAIRHRDPAFTEFKGAMTENFVLAELAARNVKPFFWKSKQTAEVDFICRFKGNPVPIEVKSEDNIKSRSLVVYMEKYKPETAIRLSMKNSGTEPPLHSLPLYLSDRLPDWF